MRILITAIAISPTAGSEAAVGWNAVSALAKRHELCVITAAGSEVALEAALKDGLLPGHVWFEYAGIDKPCHPNRMLARLQSWYRFFQWNRDVIPLARRLINGHQFDLIHHVNFATWRAVPALYSLGKPFVWGPMGGGEYFPMAFHSVLSRGALVFELMRSVSNVVSACSPGVRRAIHRADCVLASNRDTYELVRRLRGNSKGMILGSHIFFRQDQIDYFRAANHSRDFGAPLRLFAGGNLEGRKGVALALQALALVKQAGVPFSYTYGGYGPELEHLQALAARLGIADTVTFVHDGYRGDDYRMQLQGSHIYLLPSLRENAGITLMEAMLTGCVPVVAANGGPREIVDQTSGIAVPLTTPKRFIRQLADEILGLHNDRARLEQMSKAASVRIMQQYTEAAYLQTIEAAYGLALNPEGSK